MEILFTTTMPNLKKLSLDEYPFFSKPAIFNELISYSIDEVEIAFPELAPDYLTIYRRNNQGRFFFDIGYFNKIPTIKYTNEKQKE